MKTSFEETKITALILLPLFYNPDEEGNRKPVEDEKFMMTAEEIATKFGGGVLDKTPREGFWWSRGIVWLDQLAILEVDIPDTVESREWLKEYTANTLLERFQQKAIYIKLIKFVEIMEISITE